MVKSDGTQTVPVQLAARVMERAEDVALEVVGGGRLTYREWDERSNAVARGLIGQGVGRGDRVVLPCDLTGLVDYAVAHVGVLKAGAAAVPVPRMLGDRHRETVTEAAGAVAVIGDGLDAAGPGWRVDLGTLEAGQSTAAIASEARADDDAVILYTSGTTAAPKGVVASHASVLSTHAHGAGPGGLRTVVHSIEPGTLAGEGLMLQALDARRHRMVSVSAYEDEAFLEAMVRYSATDVVLVPVLGTSLLRAARPGQHDLSSVERVRTMSAPAAPTMLAGLAALFGGAVIVNMYTTTEAWPGRLSMIYDARRPGSVGRSTRPDALRIVDEAGALVAAGVTGHVHLNVGDAPLRRYLGDEEASAKVFLPGGWVRTGDLGYVDSEGYLFLVDRDGDLINTGGVKVSTIEVEAALVEAPGVIEAAVCGIPHEWLGEFVGAVLRVDETFVREEFEAFVEVRLGPAKAPRRVVLIDDFPRNAMGKIVKRELQERFGRRAASGDGAGGARTELEAEVARVWADALDLDEVPDGVSFVELGGTSLHAGEVVGRVRHDLGRAVRQRDVFGVDDVRGFAARVAAAETETDPRGPIRRLARGPE